jgi:hypothetical protein
VVALQLRDGAIGRAVGVAALFVVTAGLTAAMLVVAPRDLGWHVWIILCGAVVVLVVGARTVLAGVFGAAHKVVMDEVSLTIVIGGRRWWAGWHEIADIVAHDVPPLQRDANSFPRIEVRLATPSGAPLAWAVIADIYPISRDELAALLQSRHAAALARPDPGQAARYGTAAAAIRARDGMMMRAALAVVLVPFVLLALILLGRADWAG